MLRKLGYFVPPIQYLKSFKLTFDGPISRDNFIEALDIKTFYKGVEKWIPDYIAVSGKLVAKHGGKYLARTANHEQIEGEGAAVALRIILEWPSKEAALNFMNDPEYVPHLEARTKGSVSHHYLIEAKDDLA